MRLPQLLSLSCLPLLAACQWSSALLPGQLLPAMHGEPQPAQTINWERQALCGRTDCTLVNVATLHYPDDPQLDALINQALLQLAGAPPQASSNNPLELFTDQLFQRQPVGREVWLQAKQVAQRNDLLTIELSSYVKTGEKGWPGRSFIHYSRPQGRSLQPSELFVPGQEFAFWNVARKAHLGWLQRERLLERPGFVQQWPFRRTQNLALLDDRLRLKYEVNSLAPLQMGHPVLDIPYSELEGVLRPEFMPPAATH